MGEKGLRRWLQVDVVVDLVEPVEREPLELVEHLSQLVVLVQGVEGAGPVVNFFHDPQLGEAFELLVHRAPRRVAEACDVADVEFSALVGDEGFDDPRAFLRFEQGWQRSPSGQVMVGLRRHG